MEDPRLHPVGRLDRHDTPLTPETECYARDLRLARLDRDRTVAAWVEDDEQELVPAWRVIHEDGKLGTVRRISPLAGSPATPHLLPPDRLAWIEYSAGIGRLVWARLDPMEDRPPVPEMFPGVSDENVGDFTCCVGPDGTRWIIIESRTPDSRLLLVRLCGESTAPEVSVLKKDAFFARPRLVAGANTVMASWDEYAGGQYRVHTLDLLHPEYGDTPLPADDDDNETLSSLAQTGSGTWFAARCRERLVELDGGIASHHSRIVVAALKDGEWTDVASIDIDHGLNPWMTGYVGRRRFPHLLSGSDHVALVWEEKEDPLTMDPAPARFCVVNVGREGLLGTAGIAFTDVNNLVVDEGGRAHGAWLASRTQTYHNEQHLPWCLHRLDAGLDQPPRPEGLESNRDAGMFLVRPLRPKRPALADGSLQLFFGDPHIHSRMSGDVDGEQDELYHFASDVAQLDFCAFCENDGHRLIEPLSDAMWQENLRNSEHFNQPGRFTVLAGWEYTKHAEPEVQDSVPSSHRCVLFPDRGGRVHHYWYNRILTRSPRDVCARFKGRRVLLHHHHEHGFDISDDTLERNIEICSGWFASMTDPVFRDRVHRLLSDGWKLGFFGASDNHERNPGLGGALAGVWATENTREGIFDAFWSHRVFATTGIRPDLRFRVGETFMGGCTSMADAPAVLVEVSADTPIERVEIVRDGAILHEESFSGPEIRIEWTDGSCPLGDHYYYAHVKFRGEEINPFWNIANAYGVNAWTSPVWVTKT